MSEVKFKKGDRVVLVARDRDDISIGIQIGDAGTVLEDDIVPWVRMDKYNKELGSAGGRCERGHGNFYIQEQLELEK